MRLDGEAHTGSAIETTDTDRIELLRRLIRLRAFDERAVSLQRQGRIGNYPPCWGEEGTQVGPLYALRDRDWVFPSYRQQFVGMFRSIPPATFLKYRRGYGGKIGFWNPRTYRVAPISISIASHLPHAVGVAWAAQIRGDDVVSLAWFGDGATSEGDFHEALNIASVRKVPTIFFCINNQWAISTPFSRQTASENVVVKASAYGIHGMQIDGFDVLACWAADKGGPGSRPRRTRTGADRGGDLPHRAARHRRRSRALPRPASGRRVAELRADRTTRRDPSATGTRRRAQREGDVAGDSAVAEMESSPTPGPEAIFETTYASGMPWSVAEGLAELNELRAR